MINASTRSWTSVANTMSNSPAVLACTICNCQPTARTALSTSVIVAAGSPAALAAKTTTITIPIVFITGSDPVEIGLVASLGRPGGNMTGVAVLTSELGAKQLELLNELVPTATVIALLVNPKSGFC
jgi:ABC-type uncharacterized transport system substrate-binding protein